MEISVHILCIVSENIYCIIHPPCRHASFQSGQSGCTRKTHCSPPPLPTGAQQPVPVWVSGFIHGSLCSMAAPSGSLARWGRISASLCVHRAPPPVERILEGPPPPSALLGLDETLLLLADRLHLSVGRVSRTPTELHGWPPAGTSLQRVGDHSVSEVHLWDLKRAGNLTFTPLFYAIDIVFMPQTVYKKWT